MPEAVLAATDLRRELAALPGWTGDPSGITREAQLASFPAAIEVVDRIALLAEELDHHPDIDIRWRTVRLRCATHSAGGVTGKDLALARRIEAVLAGQPGE